MLKFNEVLSKFNNLMMSIGGNSIQIEIDYRLKQLHILNATSSQLKALYRQENICLHLHNGKISVSFFN